MYKIEDQYEAVIIFRLREQWFGSHGLWESISSLDSHPGSTTLYLLSPVCSGLVMKRLIGPQL